MERLFRERRLLLGVGVVLLAHQLLGITVGKGAETLELPDFFGGLLVIGGGIVGSNAGELISEVALAVETGCDAADIGLTIHPHPTLSETVAGAAEAFEGTLTDLYLPKKK